MQRPRGRRLVAWVAAGGPLGLAVVLLLGWYVGIAQWRPDLREGERYAIDVSRHQGAVDWPAVAGDGISAAYIKASEGGDLVDVRFAENWAAAGAAGLERGAYHFFTLCRPAVDQAANFLRTAPPDATALPPAIDLELGGNCSARPSEDDVLAEVGVFLDAVEQAWGRPMLVYTNDEFDELYGVRDLGRPLWEVAAPFRPNDSRWQVWQLHGYAVVDGVSGRVDLDVIRLPSPR